MIPIQHVTDGYKLDHISQYVVGTTRVYNNFTPRSDRLAPVKGEKMVFFGLQLAITEWHRRWQEQFFDQPKDKVMAAYERRVKNYVGNDNGDNGMAAMESLHDLGYLPIRIRALPEGSRVPMRVPCFLMNNTHDDFAWLVNYCETYFSTMVWPMCNAASLSEQYWKASVRAAEKSGAPAYWAAIANHCFAGRGHRGDQDGMMSAMAHMLFSIGTDTLWAIDGIEEYYGGEGVFGVSVNAFEHATASQRIAHFGSETAALRDALVNLYPRGIFSYVGDTEDLFGLLDESIRELKEIILGRQPDSSGLCKFVIRPDSSRKSPLEIILGYKSQDLGWAFKDRIPSGDTCRIKSQDGGDIALDFVESGFDSVKIHSRYYDAKAFIELDGSTSGLEIDLSRPFDALEARGMLDILWEIFGGTVNEKGLRVLNDRVGIIYGEGITLELQTKIYDEMIARGWCVSNVLFGVGSWAFLKDSSRDTYGIAVKATNSVVDGENLAMQKKPKTDSGLKHSAKGLIRVEEENGTFVMYDNQTPEQYEQGAMRDVYFDGFMPAKQTFPDIRARLGFVI